MGPDGMHLRVLKELVDVTVRLSSTISGSSWQMEEISVDWRKAKKTKTKQSKTKNQKTHHQTLNLQWEQQDIPVILQNSKFHLSPWESCTISPPMHEEQEGDWK